MDDDGPVKALVTGGAGFIGSAIATALVERGDEVVVFDSFVAGRPEAVPTDAKVIHGDIRDLDAFTAACDGVDVVFHHAAIRSVPKSVEAPGLTNDTNVTGTLNVLLGAEQAGVQRVVYASSSSVYGGTDGISTEDLPTNPLSPYAVSKLAGEMYCRVWSSLGRLSTVSLRYFNVFGPGQHSDSQYSAVFPAFISALIGERAPVIQWDGEQGRDFTYIDDVVDANLKAAAAGDDASGQVVNIGSGDPKSINGVLAAVAAEIRWIDPVFEPKRPGDIKMSHADITSARSLLGWSPSTPWPEAVAATVAWFTKVS